MEKFRDAKQMVLKEPTACRAILAGKRRDPRNIFLIYF